MLEEGMTVRRVIAAADHELFESALLTHAWVVVVERSLWQPELQVAITSLVCHLNSWLTYLQLC